MKLPFPNIGDPHVKAKMEDGVRGKRWYYEQTAKELVQGLGRAVRGPTDFSSQYILDGNITWFLREIGGIDIRTDSTLPKWVKEAIQFEE